MAQGNECSLSITCRDCRGPEGAFTETRMWFSPSERIFSPGEPRVSFLDLLLIPLSLLSPSHSYESLLYPPWLEMLEGSRHPFCIPEIVSHAFHQCSLERLVSWTKKTDFRAFGYSFRPWKKLMEKWLALKFFTDKISCLDKHINTGISKQTSELLSTEYNLHPAW